MKLITFVTLGLGILDVGFSKSLSEIFDSWLDEATSESDSSSKDYDSFFYDYFFGTSDYDDSSEESGGPVQLPIGPSWLETDASIQPPAPSGADHGSQPPLETQPFYPEPQEQVQPISNNSQSIPTAPPAAAGVPVAVPPGGSNGTATPVVDSLILSTAGDEVDDTDGIGVLEGEE